MFEYIDLVKKYNDDSNCIKHALKEFEVLGWLDDNPDGDGDYSQIAICDNILELIRTFSKQGHSGFTANYTLEYFNKLAHWKVISPLTGEDDEWNEPYDGSDVLQNNRCSEVFKDRKDGRAYWINGRVFQDSDGCQFTSGDSRVYIEFPWVQPEPEIVKVKREEDSNG